MADTEAPKSYRDPYYASLAADVESREGLPSGLLSSIINNGERSNADQVSEKGARTVAQITPPTRKAALDKYGIDAYLSPENALTVAGKLLKDSLKRNDGDTSAAIGEYHGGTNRDNWGARTQAYIQRVSGGLQAANADTMSSGFAQWMAANPAKPAAAAPAGEQPVPAASPLDQGFSSWLKGKQSGPDDIPGMNGERIVQPTPAADPSLGEKIVGAGEAALSTATGMTGGGLGMVGGAIGGLAGAVVSGQYGTPEGARGVEEAAAKGAEALTYAPRTASGQDQTQAIGNVMQQVIPVAPVMGGIPVTGRPAVQAAGRPLSAAQQAVKAKVEAAIARRGQAANDSGVSPAFGADSVGAARLGVETLNRQAAQDLPVPINLTKGQAQRGLPESFEQLRFEGEMAKDPTKGQALRERAAQQHEQVWKNFDQWLDETGEQKVTLGEKGDTVKQALQRRADANKTEVNAAYVKADKSPEAMAPVNPMEKVTIGEGEQMMTTSPIEFLNSKPGGLATTSLADHARQYAIKLGVADLVNGELVPVRQRGGSGLMNSPQAPTVPIRVMEAWRKEINAAMDPADPVQVRDATILKKLIDAQTEPVAGTLYREARAKRTRYAQNYEDIGLIYDLMNEKRGLSDSKIAAEDVFKRSILNGKMEEVKQLRRILQTGGEDGQQAWRELQGATLRHIREEASKNVSRNELGKEMVSVKGLNDAVVSLDRTGKLDFIFGKKGSEQLRALNDLSKVLFTAPPGAINTSNTASVILAALDIATSGIAGMPLPVMSGLRILTTHVKDRKIQHRINDALGIKPEPKKVRAPQSVIPPAAAAHRVPEIRTVH